MLYEVITFLSESAMLNERGISVLNAFGNAAILLLNSPDVPMLLRQESVVKVYYLSRQGPLARFHPAFEMDLLRRFGEGKEADPIPFMIRFRDLPDERDVRAVEAAGFRIDTRTGVVWVVTGPLTSFPRRITSYNVCYTKLLRSGESPSSTLSGTRPSSC